MANNILYLPLNETASRREVVDGVVGQRFLWWPRLLD
jgi:hypothetical protein